jgi:cytochrome c551/c552
MRNILKLRIAFVFFLSVSAVGAQQLPNNPLSGREVLEKEGCMNCHAVNGAGGTIGPDFGKQIFLGNDFDLLSKMWNHSQKMLLAMATTKTERPQFTGQEFREMGDFLYFVKYLGQPGNSSRGKKIFSDKRCIVCHSVGKVVPGKIALDSMIIYVSPIQLAQAMWNHSTQMQSRGKIKGLKFPAFSDDEFADLTAYIRQVSSLKTGEKIYSYPGNPILGEQLFKEKGCYYCHVEKPIGPKLDQISTQQSVTAIAGIMWNHSTKMANAVKTMGKPFPSFTGDQMADVISYLYFEGTPKTDGSEKLGEILFKEKGCINCHEEGNKFNAPVVEKLGPFHDTYDFLSALWNHAPRMEELLLAKGKQLPKLLPNEVKSLYLFLDAKAKTEK